MTFGKGSPFFGKFILFFDIELFLQTLLFTTTIEEKASIHKETPHFDILVKVQGSNLSIFYFKRANYRC